MLRRRIAVIGKDDREIFDTSPEAPFSSVGLVDLFFGFFEKGHCSGSLVSQDAILTAAHCVTIKVSLFGPVADLLWMHSFSFIPSYYSTEEG